MTLSERQLKRLDFAKKSEHKPRHNSIHPTTNIHKTALIGSDGFGYAKDLDGSLVKVNHSGNVIIEANVEIRAFVTVDRGVNTSTIIGEGNKIDHHCHIAHNVTIGKYNTFADRCLIEGSSSIGDYNTFGGGVIVQRKVIIGNNCIFGSGTVVTRDVPDNSVVVGTPGKIIRFNE